MIGSRTEDFSGMCHINVWARGSRQQIKAAIWICAEVLCIRNSKTAASFTDYSVTKGLR